MSTAAAICLPISAHGKTACTSNETKEHGAREGQLRNGSFRTEPAQPGFLAAIDLFNAFIPHLLIHSRPPR